MARSDASSCCPQSHRREPRASPVRHSECSRVRTGPPRYGSPLTKARYTPEGTWYARASNSPNAVGMGTRATAGGPRFVAGSAQALPIGEARVDQVWALGLVAHVPRIDAFARETARALRPGGVVAVTEAFWDGSRPPRFGASAPQPWRPLTEGAVAAALGAAGLDAVRALPWPGHGSPGA